MLGSTPCTSRAGAEFREIRSFSSVSCIRFSTSDELRVSAGISRMCETKHGGLESLRSGEKCAAQTVKNITKRVVTDAKRERFKTNGSFFPIIGMSFQEEDP